MLFLVSANILCELSELPKCVGYCHHVCVSTCDCFSAKMMDESRDNLALKEELHFQLNWLIFNTYWNKTCCGVQEFVKQTSQIFTVYPSSIYMICHTSPFEALSQEDFPFS